MPKDYYVCEFCGGDGFVEFDDYYNSSGELIMEGYTRTCVCQMEKAQLEVLV